MRWLLRLDDNVASGLMHNGVSPSAAESLNEAFARNVSGQLHATDNTSSRTRWRRTRSGRGWSKKNAAVASTTFLRSSSQVSPSAKMSEILVWLRLRLLVGMNKLFYGDNLTVLRGCMDDESVDLVYLDPPFNSQATYNVLFKSTAGEQSRAQIEAFDVRRAELFDRAVRQGSSCLCGVFCRAEISTRPNMQ